METPSHMTWKSYSTSVLLAACSALVLSGCVKERSGATGWAYNDSSNGGFEKSYAPSQQTGPGLVFVQGGTFTMGQVEDDLMFSWDNMPRRVTVSSFYMDETEVTNGYWLEYMYWLNRIYGGSYPEIVERSLPDTAAWRDKLGYTENYVNYYLRHPSYRNYPVVGVSWVQASDFCKWRSDRVNEQILVREGIIAHNPLAQVDDEHFTTESYLNYQYIPEEGDRGSMVNYNPNSGGTRAVTLSDGILLPNYRLPTEAEWEYAALALIGNSYEELVSDRKTYPWNGHYTRNDNSRQRAVPGAPKRYTGDMNANFVRGRGDYMGVAGKTTNGLTSLNDNADITAPVKSYAPNDYGLYNMAGNVSEWCMDVYRPLNHMDAAEFRPFRGNDYETKVLDAEGNVYDKYDYVVYDIDQIEADIVAYQKEAAASLNEDDRNLIENILTSIDNAQEELKVKREEEANLMMDDVIRDFIEGSEAWIAADLRKFFSGNILATPGNLRYRAETVQENLGRDNYQAADNIDYLDGDAQSSLLYNRPAEAKNNPMYAYGETTLITNETRVYKGGGWDDRIYWVAPGSRRYLDQNKSSASIGFRCAMDRVGSPSGL
jgi:gliding motility-associated lipoprotein GldJ